MKVVLITIIIFCFFLLPVFRYAVFHPDIFIFNALYDSYKYIKYKKYNEYKGYGCCSIYIANDMQPFGSGKTLNLVNKVKSVYNKYNGLMVWSEKKQCFCKQRIKILSNFKLFGVPYVPLISEQQIIDISKNEDDTLITLVCIDEIGSQFNNRTWKNNLTEDMVSSLLQQRKGKLEILGTVQDFSLFDATIRKISSFSIVCEKRWRFLLLKKYFSKDIERAEGNYKMLRPVSVSCFFALDSLYHSYSTSERVSKLEKAIKNDEMLKNDEILATSRYHNVSFDSLIDVRKRYKKKIKK